MWALKYNGEVQQLFEAIIELILGRNRNKMGGVGIIKATETEVHILYIREEAPSWYPFLTSQSKADISQ